MPYLYQFLQYIIYFTAFDQGEPFHVHVISCDYYRQGDTSHSEKIWLGKFGQAQLASSGKNIKKSDLKDILTFLKTNELIYKEAVDKWCEMFQITPEQIDYFRNFSNGGGGAGLGGGGR